MTNYFTGPPPLPPFSQLFQRALGVSFQEVVALSNDPRFFTAIIPAANVVATANDASRFYQLLLDGGELDGVRVFEARTVRRATTEQSYLELDLTLGLPFRYGMGFMLGADLVQPLRAVHPARLRPHRVHERHRPVPGSTTNDGRGPSRRPPDERQALPLSQITTSSTSCDRSGGLPPDR